MADKTVTFISADGSSVPVLYKDIGGGLFAPAHALVGPSGEAVALIDDAAFGVATSPVTAMGALADESAPDSVNEGDVGIPRMTLSRILWAGLRAKVSASADTELQAVGTNLSIVSTDKQLQTASILYGFDSPLNGGTAIRTARSLAPADNGQQILGVAQMLANAPSSPSYDPQLNNTQGTLLPSAVRATTTSTPNQVNYNARGVLVDLNVTVNPGGAETLKLGLYAIDPISGSARLMGETTASAFGGSTGQQTVLLYPGVVDATKPANCQITAFFNAALPRAWRVAVTHSSTGNWTYSLAYAHIL